MESHGEIEALAVNREGNAVVVAGRNGMFIEYELNYIYLKHFQC
jgi:hypothetical protein